MKRVVLLWLAVLPVILSAQYESGITIPDSNRYNLLPDHPARVYGEMILAQELEDHLTTFASDSFGGRELGTVENDFAADYLHRELLEMGFSEKEVQFQEVLFSFSSWDSTYFEVGEDKFRHGWEYFGIPSSSSGFDFDQEEILFLGYGIDDNRYSDYKGENVKGKTILIYAGEPVKEDATYWISGTEEPSFWSIVENKLKIAKRKNVRQVLIIEPNFADYLRQNRRRAVGETVSLGDAEEPSDIAPHLFISPAVAEALLSNKKEKAINARQKMTHSGKGASFKLKSSARIFAGRAVRKQSGRNVLAFIKGKTKSDEIVIVSAHYDHLGKRGNQIFNGADDNGTGSISLLEMAESMIAAKKSGVAPERSVLYLWVTGEEKGLLGSYYYSENPVYPLDKTIANVNVDMIGRKDAAHENQPNYIYVIGSDRISQDLHETNERVNNEFSQIVLDYKYNDVNDPNQIYFRSDHYNFARLGIPSIFFFSGVHVDYHRTTDTVEKIMFGKTEKIARHIFYLIWELANQEINVREE